MTAAKKLSEWQRRRFKRLGITLPEEDRPAPSSPAAEHRTALADERAIREAEEEARRAD